MVICKFSDIKKKNFKDMLLELFVLEKYPNYNISQLKNILSYIHLCFTFKSITSSDVIMKNGKIIDIENLNKSESIKKVKEKTISVDSEKITMYSFWNTYVNNIDILKEKYYGDCVRLS